MKKVVQKILLLVAVITVTAHSIFPHIHLDEIMAFVENHHHDEQSAGNHDNDDADNNKDNQHSLFSFALLDDDFIPANGLSKNFELSLEYLPAQNITFLSNTYSLNTNLHCGWNNEHPPPNTYLPDLPSRAPPAIT